MWLHYRRLEAPQYDATQWNNLVKVSMLVLEKSPDHPRQIQGISIEARGNKGNNRGEFRLLLGRASF